MALKPEVLETTFEENNEVTDESNADIAVIPKASKAENSIPNPSSNIKNKPQLPKLIIANTMFDKPETIEENPERDAFLWDQIEIDNKSETDAELASEQGADNQIGRYIRHDETPMVKTASIEILRQQNTKPQAQKDFVEQKQHQDQMQGESPTATATTVTATTNINSNHIGNNNIYSNTNNIDQSNQNIRTNNNNNNFVKKFISNKQTSGNNNTNNSTALYASYHSYNNNNNNNNSTKNDENSKNLKLNNSFSHTKFKPAKVRRPTALPTEQPKIIDDANDEGEEGAEVEDEYNDDSTDDSDDEVKLAHVETIKNSLKVAASNIRATPPTISTPTPTSPPTPTATPTTTTFNPLDNVKFFIGSQEDHDENDSRRLSSMDGCTQRRCSNTCSLATSISTTPIVTTPTNLTPGTKMRLPYFPNMFISDDAHQLTQSKHSSTNTLSSYASISSTAHPPKASTKLPSTLKRGIGAQHYIYHNRQLSNNSSNSPQPEEQVYIPTPPPLPPQPLTTVSSCSSLKSLQKHSSKTKPYAAEASSLMNDNNRNSSSVPNFKLNIINSTNIDIDNDNDNDNATMDMDMEESISAITSTMQGTTPNKNLQKCTITELLFMSDDFTPTPTRSTKQNSYERDSGVQVEANDQTPTSTPKDSDTGSESPKSHRIEGGLIFTRSMVHIRKSMKISYVQKDEAARNLIRKAIEKNDFLNNYMDKERKEMVIDAMAPAYYKKGSFIIHENDEGSEIFVSEDGEYEVLKNGEVISTFGPGIVFGELAILYNAKRLATIRAITNTRVWKLNREKFREIMLISGSREREENLQFLRTAPFLSFLSDDVLNKVVDLLQRKFYETNTCIVREGETGNEFFIIRGGTVTIKKLNEDGTERVVDRRRRGDYFGEQALLNADCRQASVYADAPGAEVLKIDRESFYNYLGSIPELRAMPEIRELYEARDCNRTSEFDNEYGHIELTELEKVATLGAGAFGRVDLVSHGDKTFALKIIKKIDIVKQDQVEHVYSEKRVMMKCRSSPFIIQLYRTYRNEKFVYFLMEACLGGDVWTVMSQRRFFDEKTARFIAGCVVEAFDFLHSHNIIYRDLKPENLMLTTDGYCKLVDFGFAKHIPPNQKTNTFAGTPEYVAPEIILDRGHDRAVDYWALGILIFELLVGKTPFRGQNQIKIYQQILSGIDVIQMPSRIPKSAQGLIKSLCKQLPVERLGYQRKGILDIKKHSWFDTLNWKKLKAKQLPSPIKRPITSIKDLQYFGPTGIDNEHDPPDETSGWDKDF